MKIGISAQGQDLSEDERAVACGSLCSTMRDALRRLLTAQEGILEITVLWMQMPNQNAVGGSATQRCCMQHGTHFGTDWSEALKRVHWQELHSLHLGSTHASIDYQAGGWSSKQISWQKRRIEDRGR